MQLKGKNIILTGGQGGIGRGLAQMLKNRGAAVTVIDRMEGPNTIACDLSDPAAVEGLCRKLGEQKTDILINLAGLMYFGHVPDQTPEHLGAMVQVNLQTPMRLTQAVLPGMLARGNGHIVNIGSVFGLIPFPHFAVYSATKAGMKGFSQALRREYAGRGIAVTHVSPRAVKTPLNSGAIAKLHARTNTVNDAPEDVAARIVRAIEGQHKDTVIGFAEGIFARINAVLPGIIDGALVQKRDIANVLLNEITQ